MWKYLLISGNETKENRKLNIATFAGGCFKATKREEKRKETSKEFHSRGSDDNVGKFEELTKEGYGNYSSLFE